MSDEDLLEVPFVRALAVPTENGEQFDVFVAWDDWSEICATCESTLVQLLLQAPNQPDFAGLVHFRIADEFLEMPNLGAKFVKLKEKLNKCASGKTTSTGKPILIEVSAA